MHDLYFVLAGLLVGFCVGVTGVGGGSLMTPILISVLHVPAHIAIGTDLLYAAISKFCGSLVHAKKLNIVWPIVIWLSLGSIPASFATTWALRFFFDGANDYKTILTMTLGFMLVVTGVSIIFRQKIEAFFAKRRHLANPDHLHEDGQPFVMKNKALVLFMGMVLGVFVTLSSVGAGAFGIMALVLMFPHLPMIRIIGSDVVHAVLLTLVAGLGHMASGHVDFHMLGMLLIGAIPAIVVGTLLSSKLPEKTIRPILGATLLLLGINFLVNPIKQKPIAPTMAVSSVDANSVTQTQLR